MIEKQVKPNEFRTFRLNEFSNAGIVELLDGDQQLKKDEKAIWSLINSFREQKLHHVELEVSLAWTILERIKDNEINKCAKIFHKTTT